MVQLPVWWKHANPVTVTVLSIREKLSFSCLYDRYPTSRCLSCLDRCVEQVISIHRVINFDDNLYKV